MYISVDILTKIFIIVAAIKFPFSCSYNQPGLANSYWYMLISDLSQNCIMSKEIILQFVKRLKHIIDYITRTTSTVISHR